MKNRNAGVRVRTPLEQQRIIRGLTYSRLAHALDLSYYVTRRLCRGDRDPTEDELSRMVTVFGAELGVQAWEDFEEYTTDTVIKHSFIRKTPPQFPLPNKKAVEESHLFTTLYDDSNFMKQRQMVSISVDQIAFLDYLCGLSGQSRSAIIRRLLKYAKNVMAQGGTSIISAPPSLKDDYFVEPDNDSSAAPFAAVGSDEWEKKCQQDLEDFEEEQRKKREIPKQMKAEDIVTDGDIFSEIELLRIQAEALSQGKNEKPSGWAPSVLNFAETEEGEDI